MDDYFDHHALEQSCVRILTDSGGHGVGSGTGNIIFNDGYHKLILTCGHNVMAYFDPNKSVRFWVKVGNSKWQQACLITTEHYARQELAILRTWVVDVGGVSTTVLNLSRPFMFKGMRLYMSSYVGGSMIVSNTDGTLSQVLIPGYVFSQHVPDYVAYDITSGSGSSGAAVVDPLGRLVAIHVTADFIDICYNPRYRNALDDCGLKSPCGMRYGIPYFRIRRMIDFFSQSVLPNTLGQQLYYLATTYFPSPLNRVPPKINKQVSCLLVTKLQKQQLWFGSHNKPFNSKELAKEFVVDGTASDEVPGELFDPISQALQASDCLNDVRARPHLVESTCGSRDLQMVKIGLRVLTRPLPDMLPTVYRTLGENCNERVLPSIIHETLKAVVAQYNASQLLTQREAVSREIRKVLTERAANFNIALDDVSITMLTFGWEFTQAIEAKQVAAQEAERAKFTVEKAEQDKKSAIIRAQGEAKSAQLIGQAIANNPAFVTLRQIESSREIAHTLANASNKILLNSNDLLLNLSDKGGAATATAGKR